MAAALLRPAPHKSIIPCARASNSLIVHCPLEMLPPCFSSRIGPLSPAAESVSATVTGTVPESCGDNVTTINHSHTSSNISNSINSSGSTGRGASASAVADDDDGFVCMPQHIVIKSAESAKAMLLRSASSTAESAATRTQVPMRICYLGM